MNTLFTFSETDNFWMDDPEETRTPGNTAYHRPVMLQECIANLEINRTGTYVDCTFGGGGHSEIMMQMVKEAGHLIAFDQDPDAAANAATWANKNFHFIAGNFRYLKNYLRAEGFPQVDGILADLGISSFQIDEPHKGFSIRFEGPLDMRMNRDQDFSAEEVVNEYKPEELLRVFKMYGEVENPKRLTDRIVQERAKRPITTTNQLRDAIMPMAPRKREYKYLAQVFQAIRIEVNDEMVALRELLEQSVEVLKPGGRLVVLTYHSLEDRLVKNYIGKGKFEGDVEKDFYGNDVKPLKAVWRNALVPSPEELALNPRARSAKLRVAEKI